MKTGKLYGIGLGPGDPELMTLKAARILRETGIIAYFSKGGKTGNARAIMADHIMPYHEEMPLVYPVTTEFPVDDERYIKFISEFYERAAGDIAARLDAGQDVALACVGDPFFYGSFMHIYRRLTLQYPCEVAAGVTAMSGCWTAAGVPITWGDDVLTVLPATIPQAELTSKLKATDAAVIMKLGKGFAKAKQAIIGSGRLESAVYIEYGTMPEQKIMPLKEKTDNFAPYFSLIVIPGNGRRI